MWAGGEIIGQKNATEQEGDALGTLRVYSPSEGHAATLDGWKSPSLRSPSHQRSPTSTRRTYLALNSLRASLNRADMILNGALDPNGPLSTSRSAASPKMFALDSKERRPASNKFEDRERLPSLQEDADSGSALHSRPLAMSDLLPLQSSASPGFLDPLSPTSQFTDGPISPLDSSISSLYQTLHSATASLARSVQHIREETQLANEKLSATTSKARDNDDEDMDWHTSEEEDEWGMVMTSATRAAHTRLQRAYTSLSGALYEFGQLDENQELFMIGAVSLANVAEESKAESEF